MIHSSPRPGFLIFGGSAERIVMTNFLQTTTNEPTSCVIVGWWLSNTVTPLDMDVTSASRQALYNVWVMLPTVILSAARAHPNLAFTRSKSSPSERNSAVPVTRNPAPARPLFPVTSRAPTVSSTLGFAAMFFCV